ncbi:MAG: hypothetical protein D6788_01680 [Planctomycetota bacterium]|nr:MAG: hypothetical protein D6788_01680 [Planctomycetota bacterium]
MAYGDGLIWDGSVPESSLQSGTLTSATTALRFNFQLDYEDNGLFYTKNLTFALPPGGTAADVASEMKRMWENQHRDIPVEPAGTAGLRFVTAVIAMRFRVGSCRGNGGVVIPNGEYVQVAPGLNVMNV